MQGFSPDLTGYFLGIGSVFGVKHKQNINAGAFDYAGGDIWPGTGHKSEFYTITLLDASVAVLAPTTGPGPFNDRITPPGTETHQSDWIPYVKIVQHVSQTIKNVRKSNSGFRKWDFGDDSGRILLYPKQLSSTSSIAKTSIIVTGQKSGAVYEFDVKVTYTEGSIA